MFQAKKYSLGSTFHYVPKNRSRPAIKKGKAASICYIRPAQAGNRHPPGRKQKQSYFFKKNVFSEFALSVGAYTLS